MSLKAIAAQSGDDESKNDSESSLSPLSPPSDKAESMSSNSNSLLSPVQSMVTSVTNTTKKIVGKSTETTKDLVDTTKKNTLEVIESSKSSIENSSNPCLFPLKCLLRFPRHFPRTNAIIWVVLWLWILILVSMGFGIKLAQAESPQEIEDNDTILAARATIEYYRITNTSLLSVIGECIVDINQPQLQESVEECVKSYLPYIQAYQQASSNYSATASESLSFNWNRCWELRGQPQFFLYPTTEMISAAHPQSQAAYYEQEWTRVQQELYQDILSQNATLQDEEALLQSIAHATGADACEENMAGTAWFFFTIMTTVGYGNQAPVTPRGRIIVVSAGLLSLILFAVVLGLCGYVVLAIFDDAVGRLGCLAKTILTNPLFGLVMWGTIWLVYAVSLAKDFEYWWEVRLPEFAMETDHADMLWFAFISTSTIGLGDFYLQPEIMFASDSLKYSALYMIGFVFLSTFFGKILETLNYYVLPSQHNRLENRLAKTRVLAFWPKGWMPWEKAPEKKGSDVDDDLLQADADSNNPDDQALLYRIEQLKTLKPDPPHESRRRSVISTLAGNSIHSMNLELLQKEESLLCEWLAVVRYQQRRAAVFHGTFNRDPDIAFPQTIFEEEGERETDEEDKTEQQNE